MHNSLRESFNANRSKLLLALAIIWVTNSALVENLNAQNANNWGKAKMEMVDKSDTQRVADFTKPLGVTIPSEWIKFASDIIQMLDAEGVASAQMILQQDLPKVEAADKAAYVLMAFDAIRKAYDKEDHMEAATEFAVEFVVYGDWITSITDRFAEDRNKKSDVYINQKKENINNLDKEINQNKQEIEKMVNEAAIVLSKDPNNIKARNMLKIAKDGLKKANIDPSESTKNIFKKFNIQ